MLGQWWRRGVQLCRQRWVQHSRKEQALAVDLDRSWVMFFETRLSNALLQDDVWFQLHAEAAEQGGFESVAFDFTAEPDDARGEVLYRVFAIPLELLTQVQSAVRGLGWQLTRLGMHALTIDASSTSPAINFLPHRQMRLQQLKHEWFKRCLVALVCGVVCAYGVRLGWTGWLSHTATDQATQTRIRQTLRATQQHHDGVLLALQQLTQAESQEQAQRWRQAQALQWQAVLQTNRAAIWYAQLVQEDASWRLLGQALAQVEVERLQAQLAALPVWQTQPKLMQWTALPPSPEVRVPLWQFELVGVLRSAPTDNATELASTSVTQAHPALRAVP